MPAMQIYRRPVYKLMQWRLICHQTFTATRRLTYPRSYIEGRGEDILSGLRVKVVTVTQLFRKVTSIIFLYT